VVGGTVVSGGAVVPAVVGGGVLSGGMTEDWHPCKQSKAKMLNKQVRKESLFIIVHLH
jgi:hypothetical protein